MAHAITFDTLSFSKKMIKAGFTQQQAEGQAEALIEIVDDNLATKHDLSKVEASLKHDLKIEIAKIELKIEQSKNQTIKWMAIIITLSTTIIGLLINFHH